MSWDYENGERRLNKEERLQLIAQKLEELKEEGISPLSPVTAPARGNLCKSFWGRTWCRHLESFSHWDQRLPRGRRLLRGGNVYGLVAEKGIIRAYVGGDDLYPVTITVAPLDNEILDKITQTASSEAFSLIDLWEGTLSDTLLEALTCREEGLFPLPGEVRVQCGCPDWADVCDHGAAVLYGAGLLFEEQPESLFRLRGVSADDLMPHSQKSAQKEENHLLPDNLLEDVFGIEIHDF